MSDTVTATPTASDSLSHWLGWLESIHPASIELGLERVSRVAARIGLARVSTPIITVAGTNGKGSTVALLDAIYRAARLRTGCYMSPHIQRFNERIMLNGVEASDTAIVAALQQIEQQRLPDTLTYFEYTTLAAMQVFVSAEVDVILLEVGLGGRLDAVNLWDADVAIVTSIALDHAEWLGTDLEVIAQEKAGIGRPGKPLLLGEPAPPPGFAAFAEDAGFRLQHVGAQALESLPQPALIGDHQRRNAGCALAAVELLQPRLPVSAEAVRAGLATGHLAGRFEQRQVDGVTVILDAAHNPAGAASLCAAWQRHVGEQPGVCVFAALADKDIEAIVHALQVVVEGWMCVPLAVPRAAPVAALVARVRQGIGMTTAPAQATGMVTTSARVTGKPEHSPIAVRGCRDFDEAWAEALSTARERGCPVLVCGSFHTIEAAVNRMDKARGQEVPA